MHIIMLEKGVAFRFDSVTDIRIMRDEMVKMTAGVESGEIQLPAIFLGCDPDMTDEERAGILKNLTEVRDEPATVRPITE